ncbi:uncharacterized protein PV07_06092 [Cladophialophora immunda]|uniref:GPR/FUN34 family protein n=1 Tax=Cladophialophora immunda TaxID=569365 RepID=A0A0D2AYH4_9EURO|nr:uncharacterized protein PV07_06092 [Cladophialophora immunda]KIW30342.1 hypothetical protein PV07_06092 [Cladophialophora immunda]OQV04754.1 hypothetical protein CLAIMM_09591 isoform 2 [Cladophialophora immunda]
MATNTEHNAVNSAVNGDTSTHAQDFEKATRGMSHEEKTAAQNAARFGYGPLAHMRTNLDATLPAFGGEFQPGLYRGVEKRKFANPAPLGLCAFALTTFVLSLINLGTRNIKVPAIVISLAFGYGGLVQLLAGMWEMAVGNTFGATALSSYGGFWISFAIILTPGGFEIEATITEQQSTKALFDCLGFYLMGWFIFTFLLLICTLKSTVAFFLLFFTLDLAFLMLGCSYLVLENGAPHTGLTRAGGAFGILAAFLAWYNALAGIADTSNSFFIVPVLHFPWSEKGRAARTEDKTDSSV